ncbi:MAG TPA: YihY/virulence factor BrkB family protein [Vicinamibacteria bacterium]|nr:YihY/virulence factor BrkB family protein [Vicinamibacteria bacterium]
MIWLAARVAWRALVRFFDHNGPDRAAAVAYYALLSLLPLLIFVISIGVAVLGSFEAAYQGTLFLLHGLVVQLDEQSLLSLRQFVERASELTWPGILILAWTSKRMFASLFSALDRVFEVSGQGFLRGLARGNLAPFAMVLVTGVGLLVSLFATLVLAAVEGFVLRMGSMGSAFHTFQVFVLAQVLPVFVTLTFFFIVYRFVPHHTLRARHALAGAVLATVLWELAKAGFGWYLKNLAHYAGMYGTLEGIIVLALWLEVSASIILYCGEVVAVLIAPES